jgi:putative nucleotidyltransferase with HDIG domain
MSGNLSVLFVDADRRVHQSLRRIVVARNLPFDLFSATSSAQARQILSARICDVIVSDANLPDMEGSGLLAQVQERWPMSLRILMTEEGGMRVISSLLASAHQLLTKPATPECLLNTILAALRLRFLLMDSRLREIVHRLEHLPVVPAVYTALTRELQRENCSNQSVAEIVSRDMSLTTAILKVVNTPFFGLSRRVDEPLQAVNILGANLVRGLVLSEGVLRPQDPDMYPGFNTEQLWGHCLLTARCCRAVMRQECPTGPAVEDAFLAGLLHDVGKIVLAEGCPEDYVGILKESQARNVPLALVEAETLGVTHAQIGAYLLGLWGFSESVVIAIAQHHGPVPGSPLSLLSAVLHVVDVSLHDCYVRASRYAPHDLEEQLLDLAGGTDTLQQWKTLVESELEAG